MQWKKGLVVLPVMCLVMLFSCVSKKKYMRMEACSEMLRADSTKSQYRINTLNSQIAALKKEKETLQADVDAIRKNLVNVTNASQMTIAEQAQRLQSLQSLIQAQRNVLDNLKKSIADALINFKADELSVFIKEGNVYVSMEEKLLFKSGSDKVDPKGKQALGRLAAVLNATPDVRVLVEGHTDTIPIRRGGFEDNWALSVARANSVLRILTKDYGFDPKRITASGRGEFHPVRTNKTEAGRSSNRRTEIIISPNLTELFRLLEQG